MAFKAKDYSKKPGPVEKFKKYSHKMKANKKNNPYKEV